MLIGRSTPRPSLATVRRLKQALRDALDLPEDATVTVAELACLEEGCAPVETVFGWLPAEGPQRQHKVHKPVSEIRAADLTEVGQAWGFDVHPSDFSTSPQET